MILLARYRVFFYAKKKPVVCCLIETSFDFTDSLRGIPRMLQKMKGKSRQPEIHCLSRKILNWIRVEFTFSSFSKRVEEKSGCRNRGCRSWKVLDLASENCERLLVVR